ncbi:ribonuclease III [Glutamicibacter soli]|uniref:Ribonuclease 3 n=1 Tax=Glutamicibacter soli TaxID=453836 RepID=A0A365YB88_9MICC|nr:MULTISPECIES: ribonuclease III [Micrococcaceae]ALQ30957.1 ribonuclease III [Arthrobacter sp. YC-RL1]KLI87758.1 ribonuclease III [Arthrobacter sp. YC-RL1]NAZ17477.1 ribonuclease III [Glutamicibacter soli]RBL99589.1 ribonuclease III [Glutamicibacter soli]
MSSKEELMKRLGIDIDSETLRLALTHRSYSYENGGIPTNERVEFLGDSILGFSVAEYLYKKYPDLPEGDLAKRRAAIVSTRALAIIARDLGVGEHIFLGRGEAQSNGANKASILADTMEALIGATYLDQGMDAARALVLRFVTPLLEDVRLLGAATDWKTVIQEEVAAKKLGDMRYQVTGSGPDHARTYEATLVISDEPYGSGHGPSKKEAEQEAARNSWLQLHPGEQIPRS